MLIESHQVCQPHRPTFAYCITNQNVNAHTHEPDDAESTHPAVKNRDFKCPRPFGGSERTLEQIQGERHERQFDRGTHRHLHPPIRRRCARHAHIRSDTRRNGRLKQLGRRNPSVPSQCRTHFKSRENRRIALKLRQSDVTRRIEVNQCGINRFVSLFLFYFAFHTSRAQTAKSSCVCAIKQHFGRHPSLCK